MIERVDDTTDWYISRSHAVRALGYLSADLAQRGLLPADYELPDLLDVFERGLVACVEPDDRSPVDARMVAPAEEQS